MRVERVAASGDDPARRPEWGRRPRAGQADFRQALRDALAAQPRAVPIAAALRATLLPWIDPVVLR